MNRTYKSNPVNWYLYTIVLVIIFNISGLLILFFYKKEITITKVFFHTILAVFIIIINYLGHVNKIEFKNDEIIFFKHSKKYNDLLSNVYTLEKNIVTRTLHKYKRLVIKINKYKKKFKIDSDEWKDYEEIKNVLLRKDIYGEH